MKSTAVDERLSSMSQQFCSRENQLLQADIFFNHLNLVDPHITFTMESPWHRWQVSIPGHQVSPQWRSLHPNFSLQKTKPYWLVFRLEFQPPCISKKSVFHSLIYRAKNVCSSPEILPKEMDNLHQVLLKNNYAEKKPPSPFINPEISLEVKKNILISVPYVPGLSEEFRRMFCSDNVCIILKSTSTLESILMQPKYKIPLTPLTEYSLQMVLSSRKLQSVLQWWIQQVSEK